MFLASASQGIPCNHTARKTKGQKAKIDVILNRAVRSVRACPELAEGNLLSHHSIIAAALPLRRKSRLGRSKELGTREPRQEKLKLEIPRLGNIALAFLSDALVATLRHHDKHP